MYDDGRYRSYVGRTDRKHTRSRKSWCKQSRVVNRFGSNKTNNDVHLWVIILLIGLSQVDLLRRSEKVDLSLICYLFEPLFDCRIYPKLVADCNSRGISFWAESTEINPPLCFCYASTYTESIYGLFICATNKCSKMYDEYVHVIENNVIQ